MFSLCFGGIQAFFARFDYYVQFVGLDHSGKTTLLEGIKTKYSGIPPIPRERISPTVGLNIGRVDVGSRERLILWDLGGQEGLRTIWEKYYSDANVVCFVVDSSQNDRLLEAKRVFDSLLANRDLTGVPILILANKQDKENPLSSPEIAEFFGLHKLSESRVSHVQPVSALTGAGIDEAMNWLIDCLHQQPSRTQNLPTPTSPSKERKTKN